MMMAKKEVKGLDVRVSLIETTDGEHTKHVAAHITDPDLCKAIADLISEHVDLEGADDAHCYEIPEPKAKTA